MQRVFDQDVQVHLKPGLIQTTCTRILSLLRIDFISRFLQLSEVSKTNDNLQVFTQFISSTIRLFAKLQSNRPDFETDTLAMLNTLTELVDKEPLLNINLQMAALLSNLSTRNVTKFPKVSEKVVATFCRLLDDTNLLVVNFTLECLTEFLQFSDDNNTLLGDIVKSTRLTPEVKLHVNNYITQVANYTDKSEKVDHCTKSH